MINEGYTTDVVDPAIATEKIERRKFVEEHGFVALNEILSFHVLPTEDQAYIHLAPARTIEQEEREKLVIEGLQALSTRLATDPELSKVNIIGAMSWIVTKRPEWLIKLGFTIDGPIPQELQDRLFPYERTQVGLAHIDRDRFLELYGTPKEIH